MVNIPPLPEKNTTGDCPWCGGTILDEYYYDAPSLKERRAAKAKKDCPHCNKPIAVTFSRTIQYSPVIAPERSETDLRYMTAMGISEAPNG